VHSSAVNFYPSRQMCRFSRRTMKNRRRCIFRSLSGKTLANTRSLCPTHSAKTLA